jgi:hypothetical protein
MDQLIAGVSDRATARRSNAPIDTSSPAHLIQLVRENMMKRDDPVNFMPIDNTYHDAARERMINTTNIYNNRTMGSANEAKIKQKIGREWRAGDLYTPRDLGPVEQKKWQERHVNKTFDPFELSGRNPLEFYKVGIVVQA